MFTFVQRSNFRAEKLVIQLLTAVSDKISTVQRRLSAFRKIEVIRNFWCSLNLIWESAEKFWFRALGKLSIFIKNDKNWISTKKLKN